MEAMVLISIVQLALLLLGFAFVAKSIADSTEEVAIFLVFSLFIVIPIITLTLILIRLWPNK